MQGILHSCGKNSHIQFLIFSLDNGACMCYFPHIFPPLW